VSEAITAADGFPANFDDPFEQLQNLHRALVPGGMYLCITPNRLSGPHDVPGVFDHTASGFHLKEYTVGELARIFRRVGLRKVRNAFGKKGSLCPMLGVAI
jgi:hypothetical protein